MFKWCIENYNNIENQRDPAYTRINLFLTHEANRGLFDSEMVEFCNKLSNTKLPICSCSEAGLTYNLGDDSTTEYIKTIPHCFLSKCT